MTGLAERPLNIPRKYHEGIKLLVGLDNSAESEILASLKGAPPTLSRSSLVSNVMGALKNIPLAVVEPIVQALLSLYTVSAALEYTSVDAFADDICRAVEGGRLVPNFDPDSQRRFKERLSRFLGLKNLGLVAKGLDLLSEHERLLCSARLITDIRPIFGTDPTRSPEAAIIFHVVMVRYHEGGELKQLTMALDDKDIKSLKATIDRAEHKASSLRSLLAEKAIQCLETE